MVKFILIAATIVFAPAEASNAEARDIIAVVDTGVDRTAVPRDHLCFSGHRDLTGTGLEDRHGHGAMVVREIVKNIDPKKECVAMIKWVDPKVEKLSGEQAIGRIIQSLKWAATLKPKYLNLSLGGSEANGHEKKLLKAMLASGTTIVVASGNEGLDLAKKCDYFPACYAFPHPNFTVVANYNGDYRVPHSNYGGPTTSKEYGPLGTSQSAAIHLSNLLREKHAKHNNTNAATLISLRTKDQR